jgi:tetratricopeptide (TPR) repeat protein
MHAAGVRCVDCHDVHSGKTLLEGNALCMKCHVGAYPKAPIINPLTHTFHAPASTGSLCINCHMPQTKYMQRHGRHDHGFTVPDPLLTKQVGIPNACNRCHADKDADWAIASADKWYGAKMDRPARHRALLIASARKGDESAKLPLLMMLKEPDEQQPFYWKSAFVRLLGRWANDPAVSAALVQQLHAGHPLVRESAAITLGPMVDQRPDVQAAMKDLVSDKVRSVRIAAEHALGPRINPESTPGKEFLAFLNYQSDQPTGQFQLAIYEGGYRNIDLAIQHLNTALEWDKRSPALHREAAVLLGTLGKQTEALAQIEEACRLDPADAEFEFLRGLAAAEVGRPDEALQAMQKAVQIDPHYARAWYNLGLMLQNSGKPDGALNAFQNAEAADPTDPQIPYARAILLAQMRRFPEARAAAEKALRILPGYADAIKLLENLPR